ncbi:MAG: hypothetical protein NW701_15495 [Nitrospira sp.]
MTDHTAITSVAEASGERTIQPVFIKHTWPPACHKPRLGFKAELLDKRGFGIGLGSEVTSLAGHQSTDMAELFAGMLTATRGGDGEIPAGMPDMNAMMAAARAMQVTPGWRRPRRLRMSCMSVSSLSE